EVEIDREPVLLQDLEHRRDRGLTFRVDRLALHRVAAVDLVHAEPRLQLSRVLEGRGGEDRAVAGVILALPVEPEGLVEPRQPTGIPREPRIVGRMKAEDAAVTAAHRLAQDSSPT